MPRPWTRWTDEDVSKLKTMAKKYPADQIARDLGRGVSSVYTKAHELGISLRRVPAPQTNLSALDPTG